MDEAQDPLCSKIIQIGVMGRLKLGLATCFHGEPAEAVRN
jgi:hypothetical protein